MIMKCSYKKFKLILVPFIIYFLIIKICMVSIPHAATNDGNENDFELPKYLKNDDIEIYIIYNILQYIQPFPII